jgi:hypothetical protein
MSTRRLRGPGFDERAGGPELDGTGLRDGLIRRLWHKRAHPGLERRSCIKGERPDRVGTAETSGLTWIVGLCSGAQRLNDCGAESECRLTDWANSRGGHGLQLQG